MASNPASKFPRYTGAVIALATALLLPLQAVAQQSPSAADREAARNHMDDGNLRRDRHDLKGALDSFIAADAIMHVPTTALEVARTEMALGQLVEARDKLLELLRQLPKPGEPHAFTEARSTALTVSEDLEARIPAIRLILKGGPDGVAPAVTVDGVLIPPAALVVWRKVNPGSHEIVAHVGSLEQRGEVTVRERDRKEISIDFAAPPVAAGPVVAPDVHAAPPPASPHPLPSVPPPSRPIDTPTTSEHASPWRTVMFVGFGVGAAGIIAGSITGILSISDTKAAKKFCEGNECQPSASTDISAAKTTGNISTAAFIVGGVGVSVGVVGLILGHRAAAQSTSAGVEPWVGPAAAGLRGRF